MYFYIMLAVLAIFGLLNPINSQAFTYRSQIEDVLIKLKANTIFILTQNDINV